MTDQELERRLLAARPYKKNDRSLFTKAVMQRIRSEELMGANTQRRRPGGWQRLLGHARVHKVTAGAVAVIILVAMGFSGYAYAIGSDPVTLIKDLVVRRKVVGQEIHATYDGREFRYGKSLTYSDAAITAFAELNTIDILVFHADNAYNIPKDGVEHVSDPFNTAYVQPWVGVVEKIDGSSVVIRKQYTLGDPKGGYPSRSYDNPITLPADDVSLFTEGASTNFSPGSIGQLVEVHERHYIRHWTGTGKRPVEVSHYFVFGLKHSLADIQAARETGEYKFSEQDLQPIYEAYSGGLSDICLNNGADRCDLLKLAGSGGEYLYSSRYSDPSGGHDIPSANPEAIAYGEAVGPSQEQPVGIIMRNVEGVITKITAADLTIQSSSGSLWTLGFDASKQQQFGRRARPLKIGDRLGASLLASVYDLDNRQFDSKHVYQIKRY